MEIRKLKPKSTIAFAILLLSLGQLAGAQTPQNKVTITKLINQPITINFKDGRTAGLFYKDFYTPLTTEITLSENSCKAKMGLKCQIQTQTVDRLFVAKWTANSNTSRVGQILETSSSSNGTNQNPSTPIATTAFLFGSERKKNVLKESLKDLQGATKEFNIDGNQKSLVTAKVTCKEKISNIIPDSQTIYYWDENFESTNDEINLLRSQNNASVNQMSSRHNLLPIKSNQNELLIGAPIKTFGIYAEFLPMSLSYQLQWLFQASNIIDPTDNYCSLKWDVNFTSIFTQFQNLSKQRDERQKTKEALMKFSDQLKPVIYTKDLDEWIELLYFTSPSNWESAL